MGDNGCFLNFSWMCPIWASRIQNSFRLIVGFRYIQHKIDKRKGYLDMCTTQNQCEGQFFSKGGLCMSIWLQVLKTCIISSKITLNLSKVYGNLLGGRKVGHPPTPHFIFKKWAILEPIESRIHISSVWALKLSWPHLVIEYHPVVSNIKRWWHLGVLRA